MKNQKVLLSSILSLALCLTLIAGSTFALFTSESKTNIAINSGNVEVVAWINNIETTSFGTVQTENTFELGGSATYDATANKLTIDKMAPGDCIDLNVHVENRSNIAVAYRVKVSFAGGLQNALVANITLPDDEDATVLTAASAVTAWKNFDETNAVDLPMSIELPYTAGNEYMNKSAEIIITVEAVQASATHLVMLNGKKYESLTDAIDAAADGDTIGLSGNFTLPGTISSKTLTFETIDDSYATIEMFSTINAEQSTLTFNGVTILFDNDKYEGFTHAAKLVYNDCAFTGTQFLYAPEVAFNSCTFGKYDAVTEYSVWTYASTNVSFTDCTFTTGGKAILIYNEYQMTATIDVTDCTFIGDGSVATDKAAVEVGASAYSADTVYTINIANSTATGFVANNTGSALWGNKNSMDADHLIVTIDGAKVVITSGAIDQSTFNELMNSGEDALDFNGIDVGYLNSLTIKVPEISNMESDGVRWGYLTQDTTFDNCTFTANEPASYHAFNIDGVNGVETATLVFKNCTFSGFVAITGTVTDVYFENCTFTDDASYNFINSYQNMTFTGCTFESGFGIDDESAATQTWTFTDCTGLPAELNATGSYKTVTIIA